MPITVPTPLADALEAALPAELPVPARTARALAGARALEAEVERLRHRLADGEGGQDDVAALLGKVILFRMALAREAAPIDSIVRSET